MNKMNFAFVTKNFPWRKNFIVLSVGALLVLDIINIFYLNIHGLKNLLENPTTLSAIRTAFSFRGITLDDLLLQDVINIYYTTLSQMSIIFVLINTAFYFFALKLKKWALQYLKALAIAGCLLSLFSLVTEQWNWWSLMNSLQLALYAAITWGFFTLRKEIWGK